MKAHTRLEGSLTTQASAYPDLLCKKIAQIALRELPGGDGPWGHASSFEEDDDTGVQEVGERQVRGPLSGRKPTVD